MRAEVTYKVVCALDLTALHPNRPKCDWAGLSNQLVAATELAHKMADQPTALRAEYSTLKCVCPSPRAPLSLRAASL